MKMASNPNSFAIDCQYNSKDKLDFWFTKVDPSISRVSIVIKGFNNPYSQRKFTQMAIIQYDGACSARGSYEQSTSITGLGEISTASIPSSYVALDSFSPEKTKLGNTGSNYREIGYQGEDNQLVINFKPATTFDPTGKGMIQVKMPYRWKTTIDNRPYFVPPGDGTTACESTCFTVDTDVWDDIQNTLTISYSRMLSSCLKTTNEIKCKGFKNPISKGKFSGFTINTFDGQTPPAYID
jgi:hypothetical protein